MASPTEDAVVVASDNDVTLTMTSAPDGQFAYYIGAMSSAFIPFAGGSQGNLCVGGSIGRYVGAGQIQNSGSAGAVSLAIDLTQHPTPTGLVMVQPGQTWSFTAWFRDTAGGVATSNFADGLEIQFN